MVDNIVIDKISVVTGDLHLTNKSLIDKYKKLGKTEDEINAILVDKLGRKERWVANDYDNTLTLGSKAVDKLLTESSIQIGDIDGIIYASQFPEFTCPTQSMLINSHIGAKDSCFTFDINVNCASGLYGISLARDMLILNKEFKSILIVASDLMSRNYQENNLLTEGCFGDVGMALLIKKVKSNKRFGLTEAMYGTTAECPGHIVYPECGNSSQYRYLGDDTKLSWSNTRCDRAYKRMGAMILDLLKKYNKSERDLKHLCCSQFTRNIGINVCNLNNISTDKLVYIGDKYGYTGVSSPMLAYYDGKQNNKIKRGDIVGFTTLGLGGQTISMLYKEEE